VRLTGEQLIPLPQAEVWRALNDPAVLKTCIPGCDSLERLDDASYRIVLTASIGPVRARFSGKLMLLDVNPPSSYLLVFEGSGGAAGFGKGSAQVDLSAQGSATKLVYSAKANVGGKLAQIGSRLVDSVSRKMADEFFDRLKQNILPESAGAPPQPSVPRGSYGRWIIGGAILALLAAAAYFLTGAK
jgi:uncharacterized protein